MTNTIHRLIHNTIRRVTTAVPQEQILLGDLDKLALARRGGAGAVHIPSNDLQLRETSGVDASSVDGDIDALAETTLGVASEGGFEEKLAGGVVGEEGREDGVVVAVHVGEVVEAEGRAVGGAEPPGVADALGVVAVCAVDGVGEVGAVGGEGVGVCFPAEGAFDVVAVEGGGDDVGVEAVEEVICLVWERRGRGGEVALGGEGEELGHVGHDGDDGFVEIVLHRGHDVFQLGFEFGDLDDLGGGGVDGEQISADLGKREEGVFHE